MTVTLTEMENGWYSVPITATHTNTLGMLSITLTHSSIKQVNLQFRVEARILDNLAYPTVSGRSMDVAGTGEVGLDFGNTIGTLAKTTHITGFNDPTAATIADAVFDEAATGHTDAGKAGAQIWTDIDAILVDTGTTIDAAVTSIGTNVDSILVDTSSSIPTTLSTIDTNVAAVLVDTGTTIPALINALQDLSTGDINAQVLDVLNTDTFAEPGQEAPTATTTLVDKIGYLYKFMRNKIETISTGISVYNDAGDTVDQKSTISDDNVTHTRGEFGTGP
jgi:hypothetical protein